jgi:hypothetical protein
MILYARLTTIGGEERQIQQIETMIARVGGRIQQIETMFARVGGRIQQIQ